MKSGNIVFLIWLILLLAGCERITEGVVTDKQHTPEYDAVVLIPVYVNKSFVMIPRPVHYNESWRITISSMAGEKERRHNIAVSKEVFAIIRIGDYFSIKSMKGNDGGGQ
jgi:hypothetical protein